MTEEQVNEAKAAIFNSLADTIDEINQKIADGTDFDELIATYGVNEDRYRLRPRHDHRALHDQRL